MRSPATPRTHKKGAPVTHATLRTPYVHAKVMIIDDVFVSIGTANLNRRGFLHDGEIQAFAIPQQLAAATDNPARALRTALWAEHLGIAPEMGAAVLRDPLAAFELFRRSQYLGNRYTQFDALDISLILGVPDGTSPALAVLEWVGLTAIEQIGAALWDKVFDPTSFVDRTPIVEQI
jgi:phosphatidylserine/phosphatidylglycerophosphate/cardiolipin synthase-like enzyme